MKKMFLIVAMVVFVLAGCGVDDGGNSDIDTPEISTIVVTNPEGSKELFLATLGDLSLEDEIEVTDEIRDTFDTLAREQMYCYMPEMESYADLVDITEIETDWESMGYAIFQNMYIKVYERDYLDIEHDTSALTYDEACEAVEAMYYAAEYPEFPSRDTYYGKPAIFNEQIDSYELPIEGYPSFDGIYYQAENAEIENIDGEIYLTVEYGEYWYEHAPMYNTVEELAEKIEFAKPYGATDDMSVPDALNLVLQAGDINEILDAKCNNKVTYHIGVTDNGEIELKIASVETLDIAE